MKRPNEIDFKKIPRLGKDEIYLAVGVCKDEWHDDNGNLRPKQTEIEEYESKPALRKGLTEYIPCHCGYKYEIYIAKKVVS